MQPTIITSSALHPRQASLGRGAAARLNEDVLRAVFYYAFPANASLLLVCKLWTHILEDSPELWTVVDSPSKQVFFQRSKQLPLDIVGVEVGPHTIWWDAVIANRHRVRRLDIFFDGSEQPLRLADYAPDGRAPDVLEHLVFCARHSVRYVAKVPRWTTSAGLRCFGAVNVTMSSLELVDPLRLTVLDLSCSFDDPITLADVWYRVSLCRRLRRLWLYAFADVGVWPTPLSTLECLREAHIGVDCPLIFPTAFEVLPPDLVSFHADVDPDWQPTFDAVRLYFGRRFESYGGLLRVSLLSRPLVDVDEHELVFSPLDGPVTFTYKITWCSDSHVALPVNIWQLLDSAQMLDVQDVEHFAALVRRVDRLALSQPLGHDEPPCLPHLTLLRVLAPAGGFDSEDSAWAVSRADLGPTQQRLFPSLRRLEVKQVPRVPRPQQALVEPPQRFVRAKAFEQLGVCATLTRI